MAELSEAQGQVLAAMVEQATKREPATRDNLTSTGQKYFRGHLADWTGAVESLIADGLLTEREGVLALGGADSSLASELHGARPPMYYWYTDYYRAAATSRALSEFSRRVFGRDFSQHGFMDMDQLRSLLDRAQLKPGELVLDMGCGNGGIAEYISDVTGARVHGIDYIPEAIEQAMARTASKRDRVTFAVGDMRNLDLPPAAFDAIISVDTIYFTDLDETLSRMKAILKLTGRIAIYYGHQLRFSPDLTAESLLPDRTPLAEALKRQGLSFEAQDFTQADYQLALLRKQVLIEMKDAFVADGIEFIYRNRWGDSNDMAGDIEKGTHRRYLYLVTV